MQAVPRTGTEGLGVMHERIRTVKVINQLKKDRDSVTNGIREVLTKFVVDEHIPGKCDG